MAVDRPSLERIGWDLLVALGEDPEREGLVDTPSRFARAWIEFLTYDPGIVDTSFEAVDYVDQLVTVSGILVWSICEHHLLPFSCEIAIGYLADRKVLGLSKFARLCHEAAHSLQLQERMTAQIADRVAELTDTEDVAVIGKGQHLCLTMRGARTPATLTTSVMRGAFRERPEARAEVMRLIGAD